MGIKLNKFQPLKFIFLFVISLLSGCSITPPKEYVGIWSNGVTVLKIEESGQLHYSSKSRSSSFPIEKINETEISAFPAFIFTLPIEGAPNFSEEGSEFLIVDGETLYKYNINKEGIYKESHDRTFEELLNDYALDRIGGELSCIIFDGCN